MKKKIRCSFTIVLAFLMLLSACGTKGVEGSSGKSSSDEKKPSAENGTRLTKTASAWITVSETPTKARRMFRCFIPPRTFIWKTRN